MEVRKPNIEALSLNHCGRWKAVSINIMSVCLYLH